MGELRLLQQNIQFMEKCLQVIWPKIKTNQNSFTKIFLQRDIIYNYKLKYMEKVSAYIQRACYHLVREIKM